MNKFSELLKALWGSERWIIEGLKQITEEEARGIHQRMESVFASGLPFEIKHDKIHYLYVFSLLAQLEVLAIQVPLHFQHAMPTQDLQRRMHRQLLDELFHGMVFTKIAHMLSAPYALPPAYNPHIEALCDFIREEKCPKVALMLLNLIAEGWIEELFCALERNGIATTVFRMIIDDERRHVDEATLYHEIGVPEKQVTSEKLAYLEHLLLTNVFMQHKYMFSLYSLLGASGSRDLVVSLQKKHVTQLAKINVKPSQNWNMILTTVASLMQELKPFPESTESIEMTPIRKLFMSVWDTPADPTMVGDFNLNVSCMAFFNKKFPPETMTVLMMQTISLGLSETASFRVFLNQKKLCRTQEAYLSLVVKLPGCEDHIANIIFENCHLMDLRLLSQRIQRIIKMMSYCYQRREGIEKKNPQLKLNNDTMLDEWANELYQYPWPSHGVVTLSNIGQYGYCGAKSPLFPNEAMKFTLLEIERKPVWNHQTEAFEPQDILPITVSADHRIFDGNIPVPKITKACFERTFETMMDSLKTTAKPAPEANEEQLMSVIEQLISFNVEISYQLLFVMQTYWMDYLDLEQVLKKLFYSSVSKLFEVEKA